MLKIKLIAAALTLSVCGSAVAQESTCSTCQSGGAVVGDGSVTDVACFGPKGKPYPPLRHTLQHAAHDRYHPHPHYAYGRAGIDATRQHAWNMNQMESYPWHGSYAYWRYNGPTAVVVPPTASFQSVYQWGVGNTQSVPIHHQFQHLHYGGGAAVGGGGGAWTPYWPSSTQQFGLYPVRAPWH